MTIYPIVQKQQNSMMRQQFDFLFKALHSSRFLREGDLSEAGTIEIGCVVDPGLSQSGFGPVFDVRTRGQFTFKRKAFSLEGGQRWTLTSHKVSPLWCSTGRFFQSYTS